MNKCFFNDKCAGRIREVTGTWIKDNVETTWLCCNAHFKMMQKRKKDPIKFTGGFRSFLYADLPEGEDGIYPIEKEVQLPPRGTSKRQDNVDKVSTTLQRLQLGDSFLIEHRRGSSVNATAARHNIKIVTRTEGDMIRVWRTK